ncbi:hypothetical protein CDL12_11345 [Handroanthus impetiginosus]|uniref:DC1 domain-containing protein n=1 Tax=Handroanthus impetiginosus TaxID=429701 RepID=A0A2G9HES0_9LAMI|nr:hypothetical protein CDL12_11345 [Handroanthus impetiginosus]
MDEEIEHFCHEHPLILASKWQIHNAGEKNIHCYGCCKPVYEPTYTCSIDCSNSRFIFHKRCLELPWSIEHNRFPGRLLTLTIDNVYYCCNCWRLCKGFAYLGSSSDGLEFTISISCGCLDYLLEEQRSIKHPSHRHPLTYVRKPSSLFHCDGCGTEERDFAYVCNFCEFWIHKSCTLLPTTFQSVSHHQHLLSLNYFLPHVYHRFRFNCDICHHRIYPMYWVYFCASCRFFAHVKCATQQTNSIAGPSNSNTEQEDGSLIQLPVNKVSTDLIVPFLIRQKVLPDIDDALSTTIPTTNQPQYFNYEHHLHPLTLVIFSNEVATADGEQINVTDDEGEMMLCDACITPIYKSCPPHMYYRCDKCKFFLHLSCYNLPSELEHDHGEGLHKLSLGMKGALSWSDCDFCSRPTNGLFYRCEDCSYTIDVKCASVLAVIRHEANRQLKLIGTRVKQRSFFDCSACGYSISYWYAYASENYDFNLHPECAMLPRIARHKLDKHPLSLAYPPYSHHSGDIYCEICEKEIHPKRWTYYCRECDQFFHAYCLTRSGWYRNIKFGHQLVLEKCHQSDHSLTFTLGSLRHRCSLCPSVVYDEIAFECASCYFSCCSTCAGIAVPSRRCFLFV